MNETEREEELKEDLIMLMYRTEKGDKMEQEFSILNKKIENILNEIKKESYELGYQHAIKNLTYIENKENEYIKIIKKHYLAIGQRTEIEQKQKNATDVIKTLNQQAKYNNLIIDKKKKIKRLIKSKEKIEQNLQILKAETEKLIRISYE